MAMFIIANARQLGTFDERLNAAEATSKEAMVVGNQQNIRGIIAMMQNVQLPNYQCGGRINFQAQLLEYMYFGFTQSKDEKEK